MFGGGTETVHMYQQVAIGSSEQPEELHIQSSVHTKHAMLVRRVRSVSRAQPAPTLPPQASQPAMCAARAPTQLLVRPYAGLAPATPTRTVWVQLHAR